MLPQEKMQTMPENDPFYDFFFRLSEWGFVLALLSFGILFGIFTELATVKLYRFLLGEAAFITAISYSFRMARGKGYFYNFGTFFWFLVASFNFGAAFWAM